MIQSIRMVRVYFLERISGADTLVVTSSVTRASLSVSLDEIKVEFTDASRETASVNCSAMATGTTQNGDFFREGRLISAEMVREDGEWRFRSLRADPVVSFD